MRIDLTRVCVVLSRPLYLVDGYAPLSHNPPQPTLCINLVYSQDMTNMNQNSDDSDTDNDSDSDCELPEYVLISIVKRRRLNKAAASAKLRSKCVGVFVCFVYVVVA